MIFLIKSIIRFVGPLLFVVACTSAPAAIDTQQLTLEPALTLTAQQFSFPSPPPDTVSCEYWVAPSPAGNDANPGTFEKPWATLEHAGETVPDNGCTVWFKSGTYVGRNGVWRRFKTPMTFKAVHEHEVVFEDNGSPLVVRGARNITFEGFVFRHQGPGASVYVIQVSRDDNLWSEYITFRNNIFHDSYNNDLMKVHNGSRFITIENNVFYNQGASDQHIDINSVTDVVVQDNIFFNDFAGSGRPDNADTKHFIMIKDSNDESDGLLGSRRITVRRNIFLNWEGGDENFVKTGNDGKPYHEAIDVLVENNLMIGNSDNLIGAAFGVRGAKDITFANNTVVGDLPSKAYAMQVAITRQNPKNENIYFYNNIWADPTGTMGAERPGDDNDFSDGEPSDSINVVLDNNLYWNGGKEIPPGNIASPLIDDAHPHFGDPLLNTDHANIVLPRWNGNSFLSGNKTIRQEFVRLAQTYCQIPVGSPALDVADPDHAPTEDILGRPRFDSPDLGACENQIQLSGASDISSIWLWWKPLDVPNATSLALSLMTEMGEELVTGIPVGETSYTLTNLLPYTLYKIRLLVLGATGEIMARSNTLLLLTTDIHSYMPGISVSR